VVTRRASGSGKSPERPPTVFELLPADRKLRVDSFVARALGLGRKRARALCDDGSVRVDGRVAQAGDPLSGAATVQVVEPMSESPLEEPEAELEVRLERQDLVVVSKPAGMPTVPLAAGEQGTLAGALVTRYPEMRALGYRAREPGVVHRLDTLTSGLVVAARTSAAFELFVRELKQGRLRKRYLAVVKGAGLSASGTIDLPLAPNARERGRVGVATGEPGYSKDAVTHFRVVERGAGFALLELDAGPAFRHQIRAHLAALGHPIVGDVPYGGEPHPRLGPRHALHASYVAWAGDAAPSFEVKDDAPREFRALLGARRDSSES
jgi:23S rRNA pseudouridine1911/1915/1917 synthase